MENISSQLSHSLLLLGFVNQYSTRLLHPEPHILKIENHLIKSCHLGQSIQHVKLFSLKVTFHGHSYRIGFNGTIPNFIMHVCITNLGRSHSSGSGITQGICCSHTFEQIPVTVKILKGKTVISSTTVQMSIFIVFKLLGFYTQKKYHTSKDRIDLVVQTLPYPLHLIPESFLKSA